MRSGRFCSCWENPPVISRTYGNHNNADCYFNCPSPHQSEFCGGADQTTFDFLYGCFKSDGQAGVNGSGNAPVSQQSTSLSTTAAGSPVPSASGTPSSIVQASSNAGLASPSSSAPYVDPDAPGESASSTSSFQSSPPPSPSTPLPYPCSADPFIAPVTGSVPLASPSLPCFPLLPFTSAVEQTSISTGTDGQVATVIGTEPTVVCYDPNLSRTTTMEIGTTTQIGLVSAADFAFTTVTSFQTASSSIPVASTAASTPLTAGAAIVRADGLLIGSLSMGLIALCLAMFV